MSDARRTLRMCRDDWKEQRMKILVATSRTQGDRADDFNECVEGELALIAEPCEHGWRVGARKARCARGFIGISSHGGTTTVEVKELPWLNLEQYAWAIRGYFIATGVPPGLAEEYADRQAFVAWGAPTGTVIERDLNLLRMRWVPAPTADPLRGELP
jgi:hypothetical protein